MHSNILLSSAMFITCILVVGKEEVSTPLESRSVPVVAISAISSGSLITSMFGTPLVPKSIFHPRGVAVMCRDLRLLDKKPSKVKFCVFNVSSTACQSNRSLSFTGERSIWLLG